MSSQLNISNIKPLTGSGTINIGSTSSNTIQVNTTTQTITSVGTLEGNTIKGIGANTVNYTTPMTVGGETLAGRRNIVINGAMRVSQRNTTQASIGGNADYWTVDRYYLNAPNTDGRLTMSQDTDTPSGFSNSIKLDCTTADTSIAANEYMLLQQSFEGQDVQQLAKGTSDAKQITVSFYMKTNKAFTFMCELNDSDNNRVNTQQFTTSTSWTRHILTFAADTTGALDNDNALSFGVGFWMHGGTNFTGGTYSANTWQSRASSDNMRAVGIGSFFDSTDNVVRITGLQMEVGTVATPFEHMTFAEEMNLCQRYFRKIEVGNNIRISNPAYADTTTRGRFVVYHNIKMRSTPTVSEVNLDLEGQDLGAISTQGSSDLSDVIITRSSGTHSTGDMLQVHTSGNTAELEFESEL